MVFSFGDAWLNDVAFDGHSTVVAVGYYFYAYSTDRGATWTVDSLRSAGSLFTVAFNGMEVPFAGGDGRLYRDGFGTSGVAPVQHEQPDAGLVVERVGSWLRIGGTGEQPIECLWLYTVAGEHVGEWRGEGGSLPVIDIAGLLGDLLACSAVWRCLQAHQIESGEHRGVVAVLFHSLLSCPVHYLRPSFALRYQPPRQATTLQVVPEDVYLPLFF